MPRPAALDGMQRTVDEALRGASAPRILEAGCGSLERVRFPDDAHVIGIDLEAIRLDNNDGIDEGIVGDVETYDLPAESFDAVVCWYVFEHLRNPLAALVRFARAARPGGVIVLAFPNLASPKGLITKWTPFRFHVFFRRTVLGRKNAGTPGHGPYPTTLPFAMTPPTLFKVAAAAGLEVAYVASHEDDKQTEFREKVRVTGERWNAVARAVDRASGGRLDAERTELVVVFRKPV